MTKKIIASKNPNTPFYRGAEKYQALTEKEFNREVLEGKIKVLDNFFDGFRVIDGKYE